MATQKDTVQGVHYGRGWFLSWVEGVEVVYMDDRTTPASLERYLSLIETLMKSAAYARPVLYEARHPSALDPRTRRRLSDLLSTHRGAVARNTSVLAESTSA